MAPHTCPREALGICRPLPCLACISASPTSCCCLLASNPLLKSFPSYRNPLSIARSPQPPASAWQLLKAKSPLTPSIANHLPPLNSRLTPTQHSTKVTGSVPTVILCPNSAHISDCVPQHCSMLLITPLSLETWALLTPETHTQTSSLSDRCPYRPLPGAPPAPPNATFK